MEKHRAIFKTKDGLTSTPENIGANERRVYRAFMPTMNLARVSVSDSIDSVVLEKRTYERYELLGTSEETNLVTGEKNITYLWEYKEV